MSDDKAVVRAYLLEHGVRSDLIPTILADMTKVELRLRATQIRREKAETQLTPEEWLKTRPVIRRKGGARKSWKRTTLPTGRPRGRPRKLGRM